ncbi:nucleotidyltransferase family protein [Sedimentisphaera salicampi]|uniref:nucleotidyltransferase family protein n=1 Tax=Sedimentisphaera salicampi TaxID=1941349 RepID=UPI000B9ABE9D|nr:nucleotidyltransferase family protein [Sedimentisphaera salicampi]OXU13995.1 Nucleotidyltransferase domain protein [Sedimentisphaera salicampi]
MSKLTKQQIFERLNEESKNLKKQFSVSSLGLFGSFAHNQAGEDSDIDLLVRLDKPTFRNYMGLKHHFEREFGRKVDLVMEGTVKPRLRCKIGSEVEYAEGF